MLGVNSWLQRLNGKYLRQSPTVPSCVDMLLQPVKNIRALYAMGASIYSQDCGGFSSQQIHLAFQSRLES